MSIFFLINGRNIENKLFKDQLNLVFHQLGGMFALLVRLLLEPLGHMRQGNIGSIKIGVLKEVFC